MSNAVKKRKTKGTAVEFRRQSEFILSEDEVFALDVANEYQLNRVQSGWLPVATRRGRRKRRYCFHSR